MLPDANSVMVMLGRWAKRRASIAKVSSIAFLALKGEAWPELRLNARCLVARSNEDGQRGGAGWSGVARGGGSRPSLPGCVGHLRREDASEGAQQRVALDVEHERRSEVPLAHIERCSEGGGGVEGNVVVRE